MQQDFLLSEHFSFHELTKTDRTELQEKNRVKGLCHTLELIGLCRLVLEPVRAHFGQPVVIHSGFRCPELNKAVCGSAASQHLLGQAADFYVPGISMEDVFIWIWRNSAISFGQLIDEKVWIHCSLGQPFRAEDKCGEVLSLNNSRLELVGYKTRNI